MRILIPFLLVLAAGAQAAQNIYLENVYLEREAMWDTHYIYDHTTKELVGEWTPPGGYSVVGSDLSNTLLLQNDTHLFLMDWDSRVRTPIFNAYRMPPPGHPEGIGVYHYRNYMFADDKVFISYAKFGVEPHWVIVDRSGIVLFSSTIVVTGNRFIADYPLRDMFEAMFGDGGGWLPLDIQALNVDPLLWGGEPIAPNTYSSYHAFGLVRGEDDGPLFVLTKRGDILDPDTGKLISSTGMNFGRQHHGIPMLEGTFFGSTWYMGVAFDGYFRVKDIWYPLPDNWPGIDPYATPPNDLRLVRQSWEEDDDPGRFLFERQGKLWFKQFHDHGGSGGILRSWDPETGILGDGIMTSLGLSNQETQGGSLQTDQFYQQFDRFVFSYDFVPGSRPVWRGNLVNSVPQWLAWGDGILQNWRITDGLNSTVYEFPIDHEDGNGLILSTDEANGSIIFQNSRFSRSEEGVWSVIENFPETLAFVTGDQSIGMDSTNYDRYYLNDGWQYMGPNPEAHSLMIPTRFYTPQYITHGTKAFIEPSRYSYSLSPHVIDFQSGEEAQASYPDYIGDLIDGKDTQGQYYQEGPSQDKDVLWSFYTPRYKSGQRPINYWIPVRWPMNGDPPILGVGPLEIRFIAEGLMHTSLGRMRAEEDWYHHARQGWIQVHPVNGQRAWNLYIPEVGWCHVNAQTLEASVVYWYDTNTWLSLESLFRDIYRPEDPAAKLWNISYRVPIDRSPGFAPEPDFFSAMMQAHIEDQTETWKFGQNPGIYERDGVSFSWEGYQYQKVGPDTCQVLYMRSEPHQNPEKGILHTGLITLNYEDFFAGSWHEEWIVVEYFKEDGKVIKEEEFARQGGTFEYVPLDGN